MSAPGAAGLTPAVLPAYCQGPPDLVAIATARIEADLAAIRAAILARSPDVRAILVTGSVGRREATLLVHDGTARLLSDYDVCVVADDASSPRDYRDLEPALSPRLWAGKVSIGALATGTLATLPPAQWTFDLRYGSLVLHGDPHVLTRLPAYRAEAIPPWEGLKLLFNYAGVLLDAVPGAGTAPPAGDEERRAALLRMTCRVADALALEARCYTARLSERLATLPRLAGFLALPPEAQALLAWACREKLQPRLFRAFEPDSMTRGVLLLVERVLAGSLRRFLATEGELLPLLRAYRARFRPRRSWKGILHAFLLAAVGQGAPGLPRRAWRDDPYHYVLSTVPLVLLALPGSLERPAYLAEACRLLGVQTGTPNARWAECRRRLLARWKATF